MTPSNWEKNWLEEIGFCLDTSDPKNFTQVKRYIKSLITQVREEERKKIIEMVKGLLVHTPEEVARLNRGIGTPLEEHAYHNALGYKACLDDVLAAITDYQNAIQKHD